MGRGRSAVNARLTSDGSTVEALQRRRLSLLSKAEFRPMRSVVGVAPAGAGNFDGMPDRSDYAEGSDGEEAWARDMSAFAASNFRGKGVELRTLDQHELKSGLFGFWHEKCGHGKCVEWVQAENGWHLCMVESDGMPVVPSVEVAISWVLQMAKGDKKCPKGGWVEYRNGAWYKMTLGKEQGTMMAAKGAKEFGYGPHADQPCRFTTIEQKVSGLRMWYDEQLKNLNIANPFRNVQLLDVMSSLENTMGRSVAHKPSMIQEPHLRAVQGEVDLENANEVNMVSYMSKNVVKGSRAQTEFMLDWEDVEFVEASGLRSASAVKSLKKSDGVYVRSERFRCQPWAGAWLARCSRPPT